MIFEFFYYTFSQIVKTTDFTFSPFFVYFSFHVSIFIYIKFFNDGATLLLTESLLFDP